MRSKSNPDNIRKAAQIIEEYKQPNSLTDEGNLFFAATEYQAEANRWEKHFNVKKDVCEELIKEIGEKDAQAAQVEIKIRELKSLVSEALKFIKNCAEEDFLRFPGDIEEACRLRDKIIASSEGFAENSTKYVLIQDDDSHWYLIKQSHRGLFLSLLSEAVEDGDHDRFCEAFDSCRIGTAPSFISFENPIDIQAGKPLERR